MRRPEWYPNYSEVQNLVYSASGDAVETVYIDGRLIMENRKVLTVDEEEIMDSKPAAVTTFPRPVSTEHDASTDEATTGRTEEAWGQSYL